MAGKRQFLSGADPVPGSVHEAYVLERMEETGRYGTDTLGAMVRRHAAEQGDRLAYAAAGGLRLSWSELDALTDRIAALLVSLDVERGDRVGVFYPDGPVVHAIYLATERVGAVAVGIGPRAGQREIEHLLGLTEATVFVTAPEHKDRSMSALVAEIRSSGLAVLHHVIVDPGDPEDMTVDGARYPEFPHAELSRLIRGRSLGVGDVFLLNSTSGTTGMPKCVVHTQNRWLYYHTQVMRTADLRRNDVWFSAIPAPYGFGLWTAHFSPIILGASTIVMPYFDAEEAVRVVERESANVMAAVTTQLIMMLNSAAIVSADLGSVRCLYTGGEAIPYRRAEEFERRTGATVLNFYGSNETGMLSYTKATDTTAQRLDTGGHIVPDLNVRLLNETFEDVPHDGVSRGQSACRGPATSLGYYADPEANAKLFSPDGWMLTGDLCTVDEEGYLRVVGRTGDFIIRGGKNISAAAVEEQVSSHPAVAMVGVVGVPDEIFGQRVCAVVELHSGCSLSLEELRDHLATAGVSKELWPERLETVPELPRSSGGKVAKGVLRHQYGVTGVRS